jgi:hypothetical protein
MPRTRKRQNRKVIEEILRVYEDLAEMRGDNQELVVDLAKIGIKLYKRDEARIATLLKEQSRNSLLSILGNARVKQEKRMQFLRSDALDH